MDEDSVDAMHQDMLEASDYRRIEVITGRRKRRLWTVTEKAEIVAASAAPGVNISDVARRGGVNRGLLSVWRRQAGLTSWETTPPSFVPLTVSTDEPVDGSIAVRAVGGGSAPGRIEVEIGTARMVVTGGVEPALAAAVASALRGSR
ncbi:MAG: transposase [Ancalomicrobiaceae bacterium]|nr:transposase [Ancalomicrobiaceae bacterium]